MATTRGDVAIDALVTKFTAASGLASVVVKDGPWVDMAHSVDVVLVGHDGAEDDSSGVAVTTDQDWVGVGTNSRRDERVTVTCAALTWLGDDAMATSRNRVYELVDACEAAILADHTLGVGTPGTPGAARNAMVATTELHQSNNAGGARARVVFTVTMTCRL